MVTTNILIVEDESILALDLEDVLTNLGYEVVGTAINANEALEITQQFRPDLVLMDVRIQGAIDGIEAATEIWQRFSLPVVFLTASVDDKTLQRIKAASNYGCVSKPFKMEELSTTIQKALAKHQR